MEELISVQWRNEKKIERMVNRIERMDSMDGN
jgi:hypothetical protein